MESKRILIGGTGLVKGSVKGLGLCMLSVCSKLEPKLNQIGWSDNAPFYTLSLIVRYGNEDSRTVEIDRINRKYNELNVSVQTSLSQLRNCKQSGSLHDFIMTLAMSAIDKVSKKYNLGTIYT